MLNQGFAARLLDSKGQSIVEIGLIAPLLLIALYIPADFGIAFYTAHLTQNAVREAARIGVSTMDPIDSVAKATAIAGEALSRIPLRLQSVTVTATYFVGPTIDCMQNVSVTAQGSYNYFFYQLLRLFGATVPNTVTITRTSRMRYEFQPVTNSSTVCTNVSQNGQVTRA
jgi:Flp pilus assembly protein TadG